MRAQQRRRRRSSGHALVTREGASGAGGGAAAVKARRAEGQPRQGCANKNLQASTSGRSGSTGHRRELSSPTAGRNSWGPCEADRSGVRAGRGSYLALETDTAFQMRLLCMADSWSPAPSGKRRYGLRHRNLQCDRHCASRRDSDEGSAPVLGRGRVDMCADVIFKSHELARHHPWL